MVLETPEQEIKYCEIELNFRETLASGQGLRVMQSFREAGKITQIMFHFPRGCNALVSMMLLKDEHPFYPIRGYLALNDATPVYYVNADYHSYEPLTVEFMNQDADNPHTVSCTVVIRFKKPWWETNGRD